MLQKYQKLKNDEFYSTATQTIKNINQIFSWLLIINFYYETSFISLINKKYGKIYFWQKHGKGFCRIR